MFANKQPSYTVTNPYPKFDANFCKSDRPFRFYYLDIAEYREEFIDFDVGSKRGGILVCPNLLLFYLSLFIDEGVDWLLKKLSKFLWQCYLLIIWSTYFMK